MGLQGRSPFSSVGLLTWSVQLVLVGCLALSLTFGPQLEDFAWDNGTHVTPGQALLHQALQSEGIQRHHHHQLQHAPAPSAAQDATNVMRAGAPGMTFGSPFLQLLTAAPQPCFNPTGCGLVHARQRLPLSFAPTPGTPPPELLLAA